MRAMLIVIITSLTIGLGSFGLAAMSPNRCEEDQSCWNCHTMGNRVCGTEQH